MIGCVVLTQGRRPAELAAALESLAMQRGIETDVVVVVTDHSAIDYGWIAERARLVVDCRGVMSNDGGRARVVGLSGQTTGVADQPVPVGIR